MEMGVMLENIKAVIFDLDGTLVDSMGVWVNVDKIYMEKYNLVEPPGFYEEMEGKGFTETAIFFTESFPTLDKTIEEIKDEWTKMVYNEYVERVELKDGVYEFLKSLCEKGIKCGVATSNSRQVAEAVLRARHIDEFFKVLYTSCEVKKGKPAPDVYLKVAEELKVLPKECLVFEDVPQGINAGLNAGMTVCAVDDWFSKEQEGIKKSLAHYYISTFDDVKHKTYEVLK